MNPTKAEIEDAARIVYTRLYNFWRYKKQFPQEVAEDLAQTGVLVGLQKVNKWTGRASLPTFLTTVARNGGIDALRKEHRQDRLKEAIRDAYESAGLIRRRDGHGGGAGESYGPSLDPYGDLGQ